MSVRSATDGTILSLVERAVAESATGVAVVSGEIKLTYAELDERAERLARRLRALGCEPGSRVGQCVERSANLVVAALGIVRAGCAYVAIDPAYPDERVRWMLEDSHAAVVVTDELNAVRGSALADTPAVVLAPDGTMKRADQGRPPEPAVPELEEAMPEPASPAEIAYVVYTSGSTGRPKGVIVEHSSLANLVTWHLIEFGLTGADRCTQIASPGFDAAIWEVWPALAAGAELHVVPDELRRDPRALRDWLVAESITVSFLPTAIAEGVIALPWPERSALRYLLTGGDALTRRPAPGLPFTVINNYGLSETTVVATSGPVAAGADGPPSIGSGISGVVTEIVDAHLAAVPRGTEGELIVGGAAIARGYLNRSDLTTERFLTDARGRWYRTGDRVRERADGQLDFLGRLDDQLSVRGHRVEPGEIVATLAEHPAIASSIVVGEGSSGAERRLVAYVVAAGDERPDDGEICGFLEGRLPEYMVPVRWVWLDQLPVTANGKVDREALAAMAAATPASVASPQTSAARPKTDVERTIAAVVGELLGVDAIGMDENFFLLGGHSMLGAQLTVRLEDLYGVEISLRYLFDHPTLAEIADEVSRQTAAGAEIAAETV